MKHSTDNKNAQSRGFTLMELTLVLLIIGLIFSVLAQMGTRYIRDKQSSDKKEAIDSITTALASFVRDNTRPDPDGAGLMVGSYDATAHYPCPADPSIAIGGANYGISRRIDGTGVFNEGTNGRDWNLPAGFNSPEEVNPRDFPADPVVAGIDCAVVGGIQSVTDGAGNIVYIGAVPTGTLGINQTYQIDPYGNKYTYAVSRNSALTLASSPLRYEAITGVSPPQPAGSIQVDTVDWGPPVAINNVTLNTPFTVLSHGENGAGAYTAAGQLIAGGCPAAPAIENENCDFLNAATADTTFLNTTGLLSSAPGANYIDDSMTFSLMGRDGEDNDGFWRLNDLDGNEIHNVNQGGNVSIGLTDPQARLHVAGEIIINETAGFACNGTTIGAVRFNNAGNALEYCAQDGVGGFEWRSSSGYNWGGACRWRTRTSTGNLDCNADEYLVNAMISDGGKQGDLGRLVSGYGGGINVRQNDSGTFAAIMCCSDVSAVEVDTGNVDESVPTSPCPDDEVYNGSTCEIGPASANVNDCRTITAQGTSAGYASSAFCDADETLVSGGGRCETMGGSVCGTTGSRSYMHYSQPVGVNGWTVDCTSYDGTQTCTEVTIICCKKM